MDPEVVEAMRRVKDKIQAREEGGLGLPIPDLVSAIIGEKPIVSYWIWLEVR